jgi:hypothetical protein
MRQHTRGPRVGVIAETIYSLWYCAIPSIVSDSHGGLLSLGPRSRYVDELVGRQTEPPSLMDTITRVCTLLESEHD